MLQFNLIIPCNVNTYHIFFLSTPAKVDLSEPLKFTLSLQLKIDNSICKSNPTKYHQTRGIYLRSLQNARPQSPHLPLFPVLDIDAKYEVQQPAPRFSSASWEAHVDHNFPRTSDHNISPLTENSTPAAPLSPTRRSSHRFSSCHTISRRPLETCRQGSSLAPAISRPRRAPCRALRSRSRPLRPP
jgi:hypothetical protein